jgi:hypothetical protein
MCWLTYLDDIRRMDGRVPRLTPNLSAFPELDDQLVTWEPLSGDPSPDRLDALVWALTDLMLGAADPPIVGPIFVGSPRNIPGQ